MSKSKFVKEWTSIAVNDLQNLVDDLKKTIDLPAVIYLTGDVGAGKTTFVKKFLGDQFTNSPSYSLVIEGEDFIHCDFYRIEDIEEIIHLELEAYFENKTIIFCEWGIQFYDEIDRYIPEDFKIFELVIHIDTYNKRKFVLKKLT